MLGSQQLPGVWGDQFFFTGSHFTNVTIVIARFHTKRKANVDQRMRLRRLLLVVNKRTSSATTAALGKTKVQRLIAVRPYEDGDNLAAVVGSSLRSINKCLPKPIETLTDSQIVLANMTTMATKIMPSSSSRSILSSKRREANLRATTTSNVHQHKCESGEEGTKRKSDVHSETHVKNQLTVRANARLSCSPPYAMIPIRRRRVCKDSSSARAALTCSTIGAHVIRRG